MNCTSITTYYSLFLSVASAMKILQSKDIVHRDLKPQNILLSHSGGSHPRPADIKIKIGINKS